jgi:hypothetical protein
MKFLIEKSDLPNTYRIKNQDKTVALMCGTEEDANLFANAPQLLESLKDMIKETDCGCEETSDYGPIKCKRCEAEDVIFNVGIIRVDKS